MNSFTLSLFDFLNYEVIGYLMLRICNIPTQDDNWFYFVVAYIVGLIVVKLNEKTPWSECMRNNRCFIEKGNGALRILKCGIEEDNMKKYQYYKQYYRVLGEKVGYTISILEAQYAFVWNLLLVVIVYLVTFFVRGGCLFKTVNGKAFGCCNGACLCRWIDGICLEPLILTVLILIFFCTFGHVLNSKGVTFRQGKKCRIDLFILIELVLSLIMVFCFMLCRANIYNQIVFTLLILIIILPFIAFSIQCKISELIIENDHFLTEMENDKKTETNE